MEMDFVLDEGLPQFQALATTNVIDRLVAEHRKISTTIREVSSIMKADYSSVVSYFVEGNCGNESLHRFLYLDKLFNEKGALKELDAEFWSKLLNTTDVWKWMPQERKNQWNRQLTAWKEKDESRLAPEEKLPEFTLETARETILLLLNSRALFLAEKVAGVFQALSGKHVTNSPFGFGKRMIIARLLNDYGFANYERCGYVDDLRRVIATFMGREESSVSSSSTLLDQARKNSRGEWIYLDGGAIKIRAYKGGTAHLEVHPEMAWRLNCILAHLYPHAIPAEHRARPKQQTKSWPLIDRLLPVEILRGLAAFDGSCFKTPFWELSKEMQAEVEKILTSIGGVKEEKRWVFSYDVAPVIAEIIRMGCVPESVSYQYYPTPENLARHAVDLADIDPEDDCLEPSAGQGAIAELMPKEKTTCVEICALYSSILQKKGLQVERADFLEWNPSRKFSRIVMNPPFNDRRWQHHLSKAAEMLTPRGKIVAILPGSAKNKDVLPGFDCTWHGPFANEFATTSVSVVILEAWRT